MTLMDLTKFSKELEKAGLHAKPDKPNRFSDTNSLTLPYMAENEQFYKTNQSLIKDANYIDRTKKPTTAEELISCCEIITNKELSHKILEWMLSHIDRLQIVNKGTIRKNNHPFAKTKDFDEQWEKDTEYGLCALGFYIQYDKNNLCLSLSVDKHTKLDSKIGNPEISTWDANKPDKIIMILDALSSISEFIPVFLDSDSTGIIWNYPDRGRSNWRSSYGKNIQNSKSCMKRLEENGFFENGARINPNVWYFFVCGKYGKCYLKRDMERSPKIQTLNT